jgi:hypothetical protein
VATIVNPWDVPKDASDADKREFVVFALTRWHIKELIDDALVDKLTDDQMRSIAERLTWAYYPVQLDYELRQILWTDGLY